MKGLARIPWGVIIAIAMAWPLAWIVIPALVVMGQFRGTGSSGSGGLAAVGVATSTLLFLVVPPILLLIARALAGRNR